MKPSEIIVADTERQGGDPRTVFEYVHHALQSKNAVLMTSHNSVLLLEIKPNQEAEVHLFTVDSPLGLMKALTEFLDSLRKSQIKRIYGLANNGAILKLLQRIGLDVQMIDHGEYNWTAEL